MDVGLHEGGGDLAGREAVGAYGLRDELHDDLYCVGVRERPQPLRGLEVGHDLGALETRGTGDAVLSDLTPERPLINSG